MQTLDSIGDTVYSSGGGVGSSRGVSRRGNSIGDGGEVAVPPRRFSKYSEYRDSGVEWLGKIPAHWEVKRLKYIATLNDEALTNSTDPNFELVYVDIGSVDAISGITRKKPFVFEKAPSRARRIVRNGDIIVSTVRTYLRAIATIKSPEPNLIVSTGFAVVRPCQIDSDFTSYVLRSSYFVEGVVANSTGVSYPAINAERLARFAIAYPHSDEQHAIAAFLDRETSKIDGLIERKERLIELLGEKRTALITHAVTRGLDPAAAVKDSRIEWLGKIPAHWEIKRMKHVSVVENSGEFGAEPGECAIDLPVCTTAHLTAAGIFLVDDMPVRSFSGEEASRYEGVPGDLFVVKSSGSNTNIISGKLGLVTNTTPRIVFSNFLLRIRPSAKAVCPSFLAYLLRSALTRERIRKMVATTTYPNINVSEYVGSALALPGVDEQKHIAAFLDRETAKIDGLVAKVRQAIDLLKEYRVALNSAAVTGKIDVREVAA